jgi:hypothetical protein
MQRKTSIIRLFLILMLIVGFAVFAKTQRTQAANLQQVSVTMSNSRFSFNGVVAADPGGDTVVDIAAVGTYGGASTDFEPTDLLVVGDTLVFSTTGALTVEEIVDGDTIVLSATVNNSETFYLASTSELVAEFTTASVITEGYFQVLVPAATSDSTDGTPDQGYFDFSTGADVACTGTGYTWGTATDLGAQTGGILPAGTWHVYECPYTTGAAGTIEMTIDNAGVINPTPNDNHIAGVADTYGVIVRNVRDSDDAVIDSTTVKIGAIEAVQVSATVVPSLTFEIIGEDATAVSPPCGQETHVDTTASSVPFGEIGTGVFRNASQELKVTTNAIDGAIVTAIANDQLGREGLACDDVRTGADKHVPPYTLDPTDGDHLCIWDANVSGMSETAEEAWTNTDYTGFGYSLDNIVGSGAEFTYGAGFDARHFADAQSGHDPVALFDSEGYPTNNHSVHVCYRIVPDALTAAGDYYNYITYTATATF